MSLSTTLYQAGLMAAERAFNRALERDPMSHDALMAILARPIAVDITAPSLSFYLLADGRQLRFQQFCAEPPELMIRGSLLGLIALGLGDRTPLQQERVVLDGDASLAGELQRVLEDLDPDWEAELAAVMGDVPAHLLGRQIRRALRWGQQTNQRVAAMVEEYLHEESPDLPGRRETEAFYEDIQSLRLATDRLEARLNALDSQPESSDGEDA